MDENNFMISWQYKNPVIKTVTPSGHETYTFAYKFRGYRKHEVRCKLSRIPRIWNDI